MKNAEIKVAVIMGVYNIEKQERFDCAVRSILGQTHRNIEFIICDDGSTDNTYNIIKKYSDFDNRIILIENSTNRGLAYALNQCVNVTTAKYLVRQDADDSSEQTRIAKQLDFLLNNSHMDLVGSNVIMCDGEKQWGGRVLPQYPEKKSFLWGVPFAHGSVMIRKESLIKAGGYRVAKETRRAEDYDLFMRMYSLGMKGSNIQDYLYFYQEDQENLSKRKYIYRLDEAKVRYIGFRSLKLLPKGYIYCIKPLIVGLIPQKLLHRLKFMFKTLIKDV